MTEVPCMANKFNLDDLIDDCSSSKDSSDSAVKEGYEWAGLVITS